MQAFFVILHSKFNTMKKTTLAIIALVILASCGKDPLTINTETLNLKGKVKSITDKQIQSVHDSEWNTEQDTSIKTPYSIITRVFNEKGYWISSETKLSTGVTISKEEVTFSEDGNYSGSKIFSGNDDLIYENKAISFTKELLEIESYNKANEKISTTHSEYKEGKPVLQLMKLITNEISIETRYSYDENGDEKELTRVSVMNGTEKTETVSVKYMERDEQGNWLKKIYYDPKSNDNKCVVVEREIEYY
ncbi:MAG: hypothetical protein CVU11_15665 [Bacteroidetes bacterium HGW-Bacteroidetes-6]|jgi:hypothetical protein|nr:MAG: hypothetical protein CVU11_15665 [Bacteroidetes bacterium HGW-Bacteroidetes-6]